MRRLTNYVRMTAFRKGVVGTSRGWFAVWAIVVVARFLKKRLDREPEVLERVELGPGESVVIADTGLTRTSFKAQRA